MAKLLRPAKETRAKRGPETSSAPSAGERPAKTAAPKPQRDAGLAWLVLVGLLILASVPLLVELARPAVWTQSEALAIAISTETYRRKAPINEADTSLQAWTPVYQGASRWDLPPAGVWLHQLAYPGLPADAPNPTEETDRLLITGARGASVVMALLFVAAVFWAGHSIGGVKTASVSALVAMTLPLVVGFGRMASPTIAALALSTLSIAGALWAMRPLRASPALGRQLVGWLVCGLSLALAALTAGPPAVPATLICAFALAMVCPERIGHSMGLITATALAALMLTPWILHVHGQDPDIWRVWLTQLYPDVPSQSIGESIRRAGWRLSLSATFCGLWLVWLITAVAQPFSTSSRPVRRKMLLGWVWLITATALLLFAPGNTKLSGLLLAAAPASIAIGQVIHQFHDLSSEARHARLWQVSRWIACGLMLLGAVTLPTIALLLQHRPMLVDWLPSYDYPLVMPMHWTFFVGSGAALLLTAVLAARFAYGNHPGRTTACMALWLIIAYSLAAIPITRGELLNTPAVAPTTEKPAPAPLPS